MFEDESENSQELKGNNEFDPHNRILACRFQFADQIKKFKVDNLEAEQVQKLRCIAKSMRIELEKCLEETMPRLLNVFRLAILTH